MTTTTERGVLGVPRVGCPCRLCRDARNEYMRVWKATKRLEDARAS